MDSGTPYDPPSKPDPDIVPPVQERQIGGLGIFTVKRSMGDIAYEYRNGQNILTIGKQPCLKSERVQCR
ncbi:ATP-binding protein [uncultured Ruminococcus sp.]|uniref:ATP-binding protein n=1 Tax=uncultured Ruminococcus sp. TaxID=165186 RepID=UPI003458EE9A